MNFMILIQFDRWYVDSIQGVSCDAVLVLDGSDSFRFIPEDESLVGVIRSCAIVEKRKLECNLWAVGLGPLSSGGHFLSYISII